MHECFRRQQAILAILAILTIILPLPLTAQNPSDPVIKNADKFDVRRPLARELETNVPDGFTFVAVGDCIISRPLSQYAASDPAFARVLQILKRADVTYGNMETSILDLRRFAGFPSPGPDDMSLVAQPAVAKDLAAMGFDLLSRANNHALDWGVEGMRETSRLLDESGLSYAGIGETEGLARSAGYFESPKGRIALVSTASTFRPGSEALATHGAAPGRPGISALAVKKTTVVPRDILKDLEVLRTKLYPGWQKDDAKLLTSSTVGTDAPEEMSLFGQKFRVGKTFGYQYAMDPNDLADILRGVRQGKQHSDFLMVSIHSHEPANSSAPEPKNDFLDVPADFVQDLAHQTIDTGADTFIATGIHHLGPIEIYKGRPIFYGMGNFFWGDIQEPISADIYQQYDKPLLGAFGDPGKATDADLTNLMNASSFAGAPPFDAVVAESRFDHGKVSEIRLYPVDLGYGKKLTESGLPRLAGADQGKRILQRIQELSTKYGTHIQIEPLPPNSLVGVIRP